MKYFIVYAEDKDDTDGLVLNTTEPYQIDFKHLSYKKTRPVIIEDCNKLRNYSWHPKYIHYRQQLSASTLEIWSSKAYQALLPIVENSVEHVTPLFFEELTFYLVLPCTYIPKTTTEDGYLYIPTFQEVYENLPRNCNFFTLEADSRIFVTEKFINCVEENKLKGFGFRMVG